MNANKTCLALLLGILSLNIQAGTTSTLDLTATKPKSVAQASNTRLFGTVLPGNILYWRAGSFTPMTTWNDLAIQTNTTSNTAKGLILDLRSNTTPDDFAGALRIANFLTKSNTNATFTQAAYKISRNSTVSLNGTPMLVVLTNRETRGAAESLAVALQSRGALVMGEETQGKTAIVPDVTITANDREESQALALIDQQQVNAVITETATRHRMSEAALVKGQDPEQDAFITSHEQASSSTTPATRDTALVEALDSFKAIRVLQGEESSPQPRVADSSSTAGLTVIASSGLR